MHTICLKDNWTLTVLGKNVYDIPETPIETKVPSTVYGTLLEKGLIPILCCGETLEQREMGVTMDWIRLQIKSDLADVTADQVKGMVIAYEPIWAIGTGKTATAEQANEVCSAIRDCLREKYGARAARGITIQYGGSMNAKNASELLAQPDVDGGLIGGASLKSADFATIVEAANQ